MGEGGKAGQEGGKVVEGGGAGVGGVLLVALPSVGLAGGRHQHYLRGEEEEQQHGNK